MNPRAEIISDKILQAMQRQGKSADQETDKQVFFWA
jgi:hypothetical protein